MQDWGIQNADAARVREFATYHRDHLGEFDWEQAEEMGNLLLESINDALLSNQELEIPPEEVIGLVLQHIDHEATQLLPNYWRALPAPGHFRISKILRKSLEAKDRSLLARSRRRLMNGS